MKHRSETAGDSTPLNGNAHEPQAHQNHKNSISGLLDGKPPLAVGRHTARRRSAAALPDQTGWSVARQAT